MGIMNNGTLRKCTENPRYLTDHSGKAIYLTGSHTWNVLQDNLPMTGDGTPYIFDYEDYLDFMEKNHHNFLRMWCRETAFGMRASKDMLNVPCAYVNVNSDGHLGKYPKFDLTKLNQAYFDRLRTRVAMAGVRGIYVSVMLFEAWSVDTRIYTPWQGHPYNKDNNINGIDGNPPLKERCVSLTQAGERNPFVSDERILVHTLDNPEITRLQKAYVKKVVETLNDFDHIMFEIANESLRWSKAWQYEMIRYIHELEKTMPKQHPVWMSHVVPEQNEVLFASPADVISVGVESTDEPYCINPPESDGRKVILADTDHLGGIWGTAQWAWKSFMRGLNPIFMDNYGMKDKDDTTYTQQDSPVSFLFGRCQYGLPKDWRVPVRVALGQTRQWALQMDMTRMLPCGRLSSTGYCLADEGKEYLVYQPESGVFKLRLFGAAGRFNVRWFIPETGIYIDDRPFETSGTAIDFNPPVTGEVVLHIKRADLD